MDRNSISIDLDPGSPVSVALPIAIVRRPQAEPPHQHNAETHKTESGSPKPSFDLQEDSDHGKSVDYGHRNAQRCHPKINVKRRHRPQGEPGEHEPHDRESKHPQWSEPGWRRIRRKANILSIHD